MSVLTAVRAAHAALVAAHPELVVSVVSDGVTVDALRSTETADTSGTILGEQGLTAGTVRVDASALSAPDKGGTITVAGNDAFVTNVRTDPAGALLTIDYQDQNPVEGI